MPNKFDGMRSKFWRVLQQIKLYLKLHSFQYCNRFIQVGFIEALQSRSTLSWFIPLIEKSSQLLYDLNSFLKVFITTFGDSD